MREAEFGDSFDLVMLLFGEFNVFRQDEAENILNKSYSSLKDGGSILIEGHTFEEVKRQGSAPSWWQSAASGLFADYPHLRLEEHFWHADRAAATTRYLIVDTSDGSTTQYASTMKAYTDEQYEGVLTAAGFSEIRGFQDMGESETEFRGKLRIFTGKKNTQ
jgi:hypothetical protein